MLIKARFRFPEVVLGFLLAIAIFAMGVTFQSAPHQPSDHSADQRSAKVQDTHNPEPFTLDWLTADGTVFFTAVLAFIAGIQAGLFIWQLTLIRKTLGPAEKAAAAAQSAADVAKDGLTKLERPRILSQTPKFSVGNDGSMAAQFPILNFGRDPGRIKEEWSKFVTGELPLIPDFSGGKCDRPDAWILPATTFDSARQAAKNLTYRCNTRADFFMFKIVYEWDFGTHEHAFACTTAEWNSGVPPKAVGGNAYNYDK